MRFTDPGDSGTSPHMGIDEVTLGQILLQKSLPRREGLYSPE